MKSIKEFVRVLFTCGTLLIAVGCVLMALFGGNVDESIFIDVVFRICVFTIGAAIFWAVWEEK